MCQHILEIVPFHLAFALGYMSKKGDVGSSHSHDTFCEEQTGPAGVDHLL